MAPAHPVAWSAPAPLWDGLGGDPARLATPALLRLRSDRFMDDLQALLARDPAALAGLRATAVSHRVRPPGRPQGWEPAGVAAPPLKLFGAVHGEFNLVAASLICRVGGLPERRLRVAEGDRIVFVVRRVRGDGREEGWVPGAPDGRWLPAPAGGELLPGEEQHPMFSLDFDDADEHRRRLHVGLVPTASTESWTPPAPPRATTPAGRQAESAQNTARYLGEVKQLADAFRTLSDAKALGGAADHARNLQDAVDLWLIDAADLLQRWRPEVWTAIAAPASGPRPQLQQLLQDATLGGGARLGRALHDAWNDRERLLGETGQPRGTLGLQLAGARWGPALLTAEQLRSAFGQGKPTHDAPPPAALTGAEPAADARAPRRPKLDPSGRTEHVIRCAYLRPQCADVHGPVVSVPTPRFRLASFFDPDAPARDVHIALPIDTSVKDLRKLRKSVTVAISDQLGRQMSRVTELQGALDGKRKDGDEIDFGLVCSFSIPIITICALIVLMIFIALLNIVFFWLPLLRICLPVPKGSSA